MSAVSRSRSPSGGSTTRSPTLPSEEADLAAPTPDQFLESIYLHALCRRPTAEELATGREIVGTALTPEALADLLWLVFMLPEFQLIR